MNPKTLCTNTFITKANGKLFSSINFKPRIIQLLLYSILCLWHLGLQLQCIILSYQKICKNKYGLRIAIKTHFGRLE